MVDVLGHLGMALLWATPAWFFWHRRVSLAFILFVLLTSMFPDVDLYLPRVPHHGVTHTIVFVAGVALVGGALITIVVAPILRRWWRRDENEPASRASIYVFVVGGLLVGGLSHVFTDMFSTSSAERTVEPFWPFFDKPFSFYVIEQYSAPFWNGGLLAFAVVVHVLIVALAVTPNRSRVPPPKSVTSWSTCS